MRFEVIERLSCPYTGSRIRIAEILREEHGRIAFAIVGTEAGEFPIVAGILRFQLDEWREPILRRLRSGKFNDGLTLALEWPGRKGIRRFCEFGLRAAARSNEKFSSTAALLLKGGLRQRLTTRREPLVNVLDKIGRPEWSDWQKYRFSMPTFASLYPLLSVVRTEGFVLDFACGLGHASFLLSRFMDPNRLICADNNFLSLHLCGEYFAPQASRICVDGEGRLPFISESFSSVVCADALHFIRGKRSLVDEFRRVLDPHGVIIMPHVHNRLAPVVSGSALTPQGYQTLFEGIPVRIVPENALIREFVSDGDVSLERTWSAAELNESLSGLALIATRDESVFRNYTNVLATYVNRLHNPIVNPIFHSQRADGAMRLTKRTSLSFGPAVKAQVGSLVPDSYLLREEELSQARLEGQGKFRERMRELVRKFVLIDAPERFIQVER